MIPDIISNKKHYSYYSYKYQLEVRKLRVCVICRAKSDKVSYIQKSLAYPTRPTCQKFWRAVRTLRALPAKNFGVLYVPRNLWYSTSPMCQNN